MLLELNTQTSGTGLWSTHKAEVTINFLEVVMIDDDPESRFGELRAYFNHKQWDCNAHGLIYSDDKWMESFIATLVVVVGLSTNAVNTPNLYFSEHGMQSSDFVSMYVEEEFIAEWVKLTDVAQSVR